MGRSVVLAGAARCPRCSLPPRWCVCGMIPPVVTRLRVHVLIHRGEQHKPSSTGALVARAVDDATCHVYQRKTRFCPAAHFPAETLVPGGELWILHPTGDPLPGATDPADEPRRPHVLLLDGTWRQAGEMLRSVEGMGRRVRLPEPTAEPSRYWLREQPEPTHLSTAEALLGIFARSAMPPRNDACGCTSNCTSTRRSSPAAAGKWPSGISATRRSSPTRRMRSTDCTPGGATRSRLWNKSAAARSGDRRPWKPSAFPAVDHVEKGHG